MKVIKSGYSPMTYYPSFEETFNRPDKARLLEVRRSLRSVLSNMALFFLTLLAVYILNYFFSGYRLPRSWPIVHHLSTRWLAVVPMIVLLEIFRKYHDDLYVFASHRITHFEGRLSLYSTLPSLKYVDILSITVRQDIWGRLFNYGDVELDTAGSGGVELTISGVRAPQELAYIVDQFRVKSASGGSVDQPDRTSQSHASAA